MAVRAITKWLRLDYTPAPYIKSRRRCNEDYGEDWGLLITQARMTESAGHHMMAWYEGSAEVNGMIPGHDELGQADPAPPPVMEVTTPPSEEVTRSDPSTTFGVEEVANLPIPPAPNAQRNRLPTLEEAFGADRLQIIPYTGGPRVLTEEEVLPTARGVIPLPAPKYRPSILERALDVLVSTWRPASQALDALVRPLPQEDGLPAGLELQKEGAPMEYITAHMIAMELRSMFGWQLNTPANRELGNRVARDILRDRCGANRENTWYLSSLGLQMWFQPTLCDLAIKAGPQNFLVGEVYARCGVETRVKPKILSPHIKVKLAARPRPVKRVSYNVDVLGPSADYGVHNNSLNNLIRGVNERVFYTNNTGKRPLAPAVNAFRAVDCSGLQQFRITPWTLDQVWQSYTGSQRVRYQQAVESLYLKPLTRSDARVSTFIKAEKVNFRAKPDPAPRVIQPRDPRFNAVFAQYIKPLEPMLYKALGKLYKYPCVAKGFNAVETGEIVAKKWKMFDNPVCVGLDASRFDQHVSVDALRFTHGVYRKFVKNPEFDKLLRWMYTNHCRGASKDGFVKYTVQGCRMSGDMDTALGNCVLMVLMTRHLLLTLGIPHELLDNGDDCIVIMDREHLDKFNLAVKPYYSNLGFTMKVEEPVYTLERVDFCQTRPVYDGQKWRMVRHISSNAKDCCTVINWEQLPAWLTAIGECGLAVAGGIPIHNSFLRYLCRVGGAKGKVERHLLWKNEGLNWYRMGMDLSHESVVTDESRLSFNAAFGISPAMQRAIEGIFDRIGAPTINGCDYRLVKTSECREVSNMPSRHYNHYFEDCGMLPAGSQERYVSPGNDCFDISGFSAEL
uniref:RNA-directed RNA polymerase n=2 Tax=Ethiopian tobacco bushy top virus TaxID=1538549 RepID=A0A7H1JG56_9TOMB|nr:RNA-dependent RNA polymerase [Ethiopian tobacco bushy top virus]